MTQVPTANPSATLLTPPEPTLYSRKNYWVFVVEGGLYMSGVAFVSQDSILPGIVRQLDGPDWLLAYIPMLMMVGFTLPTLFTAGWMDRQGVLMPLIRISGLFQRLPYLVTAIALLAFGHSHPSVALAAVVACPLISGLMGGLTISGWIRMTSRTVPGKKRSSASALRNLMAGVFGIGAGLLVEQVLDRFPPLTGFAILHAIAFGFLMLSYSVFLFTEEPYAEKSPAHAHHTLRGQWLRMLAILREDVSFRWYLVSRVLGATVFATVPFMAVTALEVTGRGESFTGRLLAFQMAGMIAGNIAGGVVGDRYGSRKVLLSTRGCFLVASILLMVAHTPLLFCLAFFLWGLTFSQQMIGEQTYVVEAAAGRPIPSYVALTSAMQLVTVLTMGVISQWMMGWGRGILPVALFSFSGAALSAILIKTRVPEPRPLPRSD